MAKMPNYYKIHTDGCTVELEPIYEELVPVVHGRWIAIKVPNEWDKGQCSECRSIFNSSVWGTNYCPNCGAKMDGGAE